MWNFTHLILEVYHPYIGGLICLICPLKISEMICARILIRLNRQNVFTC